MLDPEKVSDEEERLKIMGSEAFTKVAEKIHKYMTQENMMEELFGFLTFAALLIFIYKMG